MEDRIVSKLKNTQAQNETAPWKSGTTNGPLCQTANSVNIAHTFKWSFNMVQMND